MKQLLTTLQLAVVCAICILGAAGCSKQTSTTQDPAPAGSQANRWTCSMHPEVNQAEAGKCPTCGMDLIQKQS